MGLSTRVQEIIGDIVFICGVVAAIYVYFSHSRSWGIGIIIAMIVVLILSYLASFKSFFYRMHFAAILKACKPYPIVKEDIIVKKVRQSPEKVRQSLFEMARSYNGREIVVFTKRYYLYVAKEVVDETINRLNLRMKQEGMMGSVFNEVIKELIQKYRFETRAEVEAVIARIRELGLIQLEKPKKEEDDD